MKKINFLQQASTEQREVAEKLLQSISFVENRNTVTKFLTNFEQIVLSQIVTYNYSDFKVEFFGGFDDAERKKAKIISNEYYDVDYDIVCLKAKFNNKFNKVEHRNILGAVHNLGINFNRFGDIIVLENEVYIFVDDEIADYIAMEFTKAGRVNLDFQRVDLTEVKIEKKYEDFEIVSSSFRIDSIVAKITNKSRSKVKEFLEQDFIKLNHVILRNGEKTCTPDDIISIRKYGRYVVKDYTQNKKSLKYRITISKLV
jgi:putative S4 domain-containing protein